MANFSMRTMTQSVIIATIAKRKGLFAQAALAEEVSGFVDFKAGRTWKETRLPCGLEGRYHPRPRVARRVGS
jgi:hypothetical protein